MEELGELAIESGKGIVCITSQSMASMGSPGSPDPCDSPRRTWTKEPAASGVQHEADEAEAELLAD